ncbi:hypothetical protein GJV26_08835 [Massilia dura]|uniref:DUF2141 domain-containing protein n=1 Tax=Pseudoduganella dura TaxID=321982 RepID=A0A6I3XEA6_9BURK|nr:hypothetical protein [Pseudoduganella dura]MUI12573.1 hypothetical protein [Pseudoduganella dura]GGY04050.1 hypothetical protein GCM10007386_38610 [Pseudoduganella dura]
MQARLYGIIGCMLTFGVVAACSIDSTQAEAAGQAATGKPRKTSAVYALRQGESVMLAPGTRLKLERINDSRCKQGAVCVWAGYISYSFTLTSPHGTRNFVLAENMPNAKPVVTQDGLTFALEKLEPPEPPALHAPAPDYRVSLRVSIAQPAQPAQRAQPAKT